MAASLLTHKPELYNKSASHRVRLRIIRSDCLRLLHSLHLCRNANFVYSDAATAPVVSMLNLQPGERVLDIGCGSGELTVRLLDLVGDEGDVWGTDSNADMVRTFHSRPRGPARARDRFVDGNVRFGEQLEAAVAKSKKLEGKVFQSDAQDLQLPEGFERSFDKVFTSASSSAAPPGPFPLHTYGLTSSSHDDSY